jgi:membrane protease YdiL (CAAX protease family)
LEERKSEAGGAVHIPGALCGYDMELLMMTALGARRPGKRDDMKKVAAGTALAFSVGFIILMWSRAIVMAVFFPGFAATLLESNQHIPYMFANGVFLVLAVSLLLHLSGESYADIGLSKQGTLRQLGLGCLSGVLILILNMFIVSTVVDALLPKTLSPGVDMSRFFSDTANLPVLLLLALFKAGFQEELWRIFILTRFEKLFGRSGLLVALLLSSVLFGAGHLYQGMGGMVEATVRGLLRAAVYLRKRSALEVMSSHAIYDIISMILGFLIYG